MSTNNHALPQISAGYAQLADALPFDVTTREASILQDFTPAEAIFPIPTQSVRSYAQLQAAEGGSGAGTQHEGPPNESADGLIAALRDASNMGAGVRQEAFLTTQTTRKKLGTTLKAEIDAMVVEFRQKLEKFASDNRVQTTAVEQYVWRPRRDITNLFQLFQSCEVGKKYVNDYKSQHPDANAGKAYHAFKAEKGDDAEKIIHDSCLQSYEGGKSSDIRGAYKLRATIVNRMRNEYEKLFTYMEMRHGLSFVWAYASANRGDDFDTTIITPNASDALLRLLNQKHSMRGLVDDLGMVLKGELVKKEAFNDSFTSLPVVSAKATVAIKQRAVKASLLASFNAAIHTAATLKGTTPKFRKNISYQENILKDFGVRLVIDSICGVSLDELARGGKTVPELKNQIAALKASQIRFEVLPELRQQKDDSQKGKKRINGSGTDSSCRKRKRQRNVAPEGSEIEIGDVGEHEDRQDDSERQRGDEDTATEGDESGSDDEDENDSGGGSDEEP
ncbi:hypothetical protein AYX14_01519 [Cryptococcus neoformans]|nr:hypothetical protein AYX14_01519 [Cryptococcus neoformans var. grubii]